jgi:hypothetical protein
MRGLVGRPYAMQRAALVRVAARLRVAARQAPDTDAPPFQYLGGEASDIALNARVPFALDAYLRAKAPRLARLARYSLTLMHERPFQPRWLSAHPELSTAGGTLAWLSQWEGTIDGCYVIVGSGYATGAFSRGTRGDGVVRVMPQCRRAERRLATPPREGAARIVADRQGYLLVRTRAGGCYALVLRTARLRAARTARCAVARRS